MESNFIKKNCSLLVITFILVIISFVFIHSEIANLENNRKKPKDKETAALSVQNDLAKKEADHLKLSESKQNSAVFATQNPNVKIQTNSIINNPETNLNNINDNSVKKTSSEIIPLKLSQAEPLPVQIPKANNNGFIALNALPAKNTLKDGTSKIVTVEKETVAINAPLTPSFSLEEKLKEPAVPKEIKENHVLHDYNDGAVFSENSSSKITFAEPLQKEDQNNKSSAVFNNVSDNKKITSLTAPSENSAKKDPNESKLKIPANSEKITAPVINPTAPVSIPSKPVLIAKPALTPQNIPEPIKPIAAPNDKKELPIVNPTAPVKIPASAVKKNESKDSLDLIPVMKPADTKKSPSVVSPTAPVLPPDGKPFKAADPATLTSKNKISVSEKTSSADNDGIKLNAQKLTDSKISAPESPNAQSGTNKSSVQNSNSVPREALKSSDAVISKSVPKKDSASQSDVTAAGKPLVNKMENESKLKTAASARKVNSVERTLPDNPERAVKLELTGSKNGSVLENQFWYISSENTPNCLLSPKALCYQSLKNNAWIPSSFEEFSKDNNADYSTVVFIHGNLTDAAVAIEDACALYCRLANLQKMSPSARPIRFVIWKWRSEKTMAGIRRDSQYKASLAECDGLCLAGFLNSLNPESRTTVFAFSFGALSFGNALNVIGKTPVARNMRGVLILAACDYCDYSNVGRFAPGLASLKMLLNVYNPTDRALRFYPLLYGLHGPEAAGTKPLPQTVPLAEGAFSINASCYGPEHKFVKIIYAVPEQTLENLIFSK